MNFKEIRDIISLMNENDLSEIEIEREGMKIKLKKISAEAVESARRPPPDYHIETQPVSKAAEGAAVVAASNRKEIKSPMVGTFYRASSPEAPSFVEAGQVIEVGQVVCIIEAMKLMNEIKSEVRGKIVEIHVENAQSVEFGQPLFSVEPV
jgi:acetyl-CoA carboxylase biotin carboxyl carrier protein